MLNRSQKELGDKIVALLNQNTIPLISILDDDTQMSRISNGSVEILPMTENQGEIEVIEIETLMRSAETEEVRRTEENNLLRQAEELNAILEQ